MKFVGPILDGVYYRLGLNGGDGKPSNKRIVWTLVVFALTAGFLSLCARTIAAGKDFTEALGIYGLGLLAGAGGHYLVSQKQQLGADADTEPRRDSLATPAPPAP